MNEAIVVFAFCTMKVVLASGAVSDTPSLVGPGRAGEITITPSTPVPTAGEGDTCPEMTLQQTANRRRTKEYDLFIL